MGKARERQIIPQDGQAHGLPRNGLGGKFQAKSSGWDENRTFLEGDVIEVAVRNGRWVLTHLTHGPRPAAPAPEHYFPTEE